MNFEQYVPAALIFAAIFGTWFDMRRQVTSVRDEIKDVRTEVKDVRTDLGQEIKDVRTNLGQEIKDVRTNLGNEIRDVRTELFTLNGRVSHIEGLLTPRPQHPPAAAEGHPSAVK